VVARKLSAKLQNTRVNSSPRRFADLGQAYSTSKFEPRPSGSAFAEVRLGDVTNEADTAGSALFPSCKPLAGIANLILLPKSEPTWIVV
jgi:hypothetical protein